MERDWRADLAQDSRQKIVNKIMETLQRHMPVSGQEGMNELRKIAWRFEEKIFRDATDQNDYLRKISLKMISLDNKAPSVPSNPLTVNSNGAVQNNLNSLDSASLLTQQPMRNQGQALGTGLQLPGQAQSRQQALLQSAQSGLMAGGMQSSCGLGSSLSNLSGLSQPLIQNVTGQGLNLSNITGLSQSSLNNTTGQSLSQSTLLANQRLQMQAKQQHQQLQQAAAHQQQQQHQHQQQQQLLYQQRLQQQQAVLLKQKLQQQPLFQQQQQQSLQHSVLQQQPQSVHQQQQSVLQQPIQILQSQQQPQSLLNQQSSAQSLQQQQQQLLQQQLLQQAKAHHQQAQQTGASMSALLSQPQQQQSQLTQQAQPPELLSQPQQQPMLSQSQNQLLSLPSSQQQQQPATIQEQQQRLQQSTGLMQQHLLDQQKQQLIQVQQQQQQRGVSETSSTSVDSSGQTGQSGVVDPQDVVWAKMQVLKDKYLLDMKDLHERLTSRSQQPMPQEQLEKLTYYRNVLHCIIPYLIAPKGSLPGEFKQEKLDAFEKQIVNIMETFKRRRQNPLQQQVQAQQQSPATGSVLSTQQHQHSQQASQMSQQDKQMQQIEQLNAPTPGATLQSNNFSSLQQNAMAILQPAMSSLQQNIVQPNTLSVLQASGVNSLQQNTITPIHQSSMTSLQSNANMMQQNSITSPQTNGNMIQRQPQQVLQHDQQQLLQVQQQQRLLKDHEHLKQLQQRQFLQQQQQQQLLQQKQHHVAQFQAQLHLLQNDANSDLKMDHKVKQAAVMKQVLLQQQQQQQKINQRALLHQQLQQQQLKVGQSQLVSSPQLLQAASPQISQQMSPQVDQQSIIGSSLQVPRIGTPLQSATSPFMAPFSSILTAASPMVEDTETKVSTPAISTITTASSTQIPHSTMVTPTLAQPVAIGTGLSMLPLLGDFLPSPQNMAGQDGLHSLSPGASLGERQVSTDPPLERLIKMINSMSPKALYSAINDIGSLISLSDKLASSAPGSHSRAAVGEDLALLTKCRSQARTLLSQEGSASTKRRRYIDSMALSVVSSDGSIANSLQKMNDPCNLEIESTATSRMKRPRFEISISLEEEMRQINEQLIDTSVVLSENCMEEAAAEGKGGLVVICSYNAVAVNTDISFCNNLFQMVSISPLRLLIPSSYPDCSPVVLPDNLSPDFNHPASHLARHEFSRVVQCLPQPLLLRAIAMTWDECARNAVIEVATLHGGGCFSSSHGVWESCISA